MSITISHPTGILEGRISLPLSKSESNRILILQAFSEGKIEIGEVSDARDTKILQAVLASDSIEIDIQDAGTAMRFLTAYYCAINQHKILTGSERMLERPIGVLVEALKEIGFNIKHLQNEGLPPLEITPTDLSQLKNKISIAGNVSSQYISALMMIAPVLSAGLTIHFTTPLVSKPYIMLTMAIMKEAGIESVLEDDKIQIAHQPFQRKKISASADWSAAGYWYSMAALSQQSDFVLEGLKADSYQGDRQITDWIESFGVVVIDKNSDGIVLNSANSKNPINPDLHFDFTHHPDLAQTMIVLCAAKGLGATFTGLESLRIKETDRIVALQNELLKFGISLSETEKGFWQLSGTFTMSHQTIKTYNDHRMAMAFAPLALLGPITIKNPEVVAKSYPNFWSEMEKVGFEITSNIPR